MFIRRVFEELGGPAERAGVTLMPAMGFDFVPGALAGALALRDAGPAATRVDVGYFSLGMGADGASAGTRESLVGATLNDNHAFRDGTVRTVRPAERVRTFDVKGKARSAISVGGAEHFTLPPAHAALLEVNVYLGWFGPLAKPMQAGALAGTVALKLPGVRSVLQAAGERLVSLAGAPEPGTTPDTLSWIAAVAYDPPASRSPRSTSPAPTPTTSRPPSWPGRRGAPRAATGRKWSARPGRSRRSASTRSRGLCRGGPEPPARPGRRVAPAKSTAAGWGGEGAGRGGGFRPVRAAAETTVRKP